MPIAASSAGCLAQGLDFSGCQLIARPDLAVLAPERRQGRLPANLKQPMAVSQLW
jgi:hypothetical protein